MGVDTTKRIAKNTFIMYIRMVTLMFIAFYTSRLLLKILGVEDFGVYSVVGSLSSSFVALKSLFSESIQRFLNVSKGKGANFISEQIAIFNMSIIIHIVLAIIFIVVVEGVGLWLLYNKLSIPEGRFDAAFFVFQMAVLSTAISIISIPYDALIIANEKMGIYAGISIFDGFLKLLFILLLPIIGYDDLKEYSALLVIIPFSTLVIQIFYCRVFDECKYKLSNNKSLFKEVSSLAGWNFLGNISFSLIHEGINMLLNVYGGVLMNAARSIAYQVKSATSQLSTNTMVPIRPIIMQLSVQKSRDEYYDTICMLSRLSFYTILIPVVPLFVYCPQLLNVWLVGAPESSVLFTRLILIGLLIRSLHEPINIVYMALGKIRRMMILESLIMLFFLFIIFLSLKESGLIWLPFAIMSVMEAVIIFALLINAKHEINFSLYKYCRFVVLPLLKLACVSICIGYLFYSTVLADSTFQLICIILILMILVVVVCYVFMNKKERSIITRIIKNKMNGKNIH